jgi:hypothetical protein
MPVLDVKQKCFTVVGLEAFCKIPIMITNKYSSAISNTIFQVTGTSMYEGMTILANLCYSKPGVDFIKQFMT